MQDLVDTLRVIEEVTRAMPEPKLLNAAGKEPLGGGVSVGITASLQNALLAFEARGGPSFVQCFVSGGNLVAFDEFDVVLTTPIQTTAFTQVILTSSSSATLTSVSTKEEIAELTRDLILSTEAQTPGAPGTILDHTPVP